MLLYHYRAVGGVQMPVLHDGDEKSLREMFKSSVTPIVSVVSLDDQQVREAELVKLRQRLQKTRKSQIGLRFNLEQVIQSWPSGN